MKWEDIHIIIVDRTRDRSPIITEAMRVRERYNGDVVIPLPDHENAPIHPDYSPNMVLDTVENLAMAAASTMPKIYAPAVSSETAPQKRAEKRRRVWQGVWEYSHWQMLSRRMYRHLAGYGTSAVMAVPDIRAKRTKVILYDPLGAFPEELAPEESRPPENVGFVTIRSSEYIRTWWPDAIGTGPNKLPWEMLKEWQSWEIVEWYDADDIVFGTLGPIDRAGQRQNLTDQALHSVELSRMPNRAGQVPGFMPKRVTLDRIAAHVSKIVGIQDMFAYLTAVEIAAAEKAVWPDLYGIAADGRMPELITGDGKWLDGRTGEINLTTGVQALGLLQSTPGPMTTPTLDRLERSARIQGGNPAINSGELNGAVRSGQVISQLMASSTDPRIKEMHEIGEITMEVVNEAIAKVDKGYWGRRQISLYSGQGTDKTLVKYRPADVWEESCYSSVEYDMAGFDVVSSGVALAGMNSQRLMSRKTAIARHPLTRNPDQEYTDVMIDDLIDSQMMAIRQMAQAGALAVTDLNNLIRKVQNGTPLVEAWDQVQREAQERQAQAAPAGAPETMPGAEQPVTAGIEQPAEELAPAIPGPGQNVANLREISNALVAPVRGANALA